MLIIILNSILLILDDPTLKDPYSKVTITWMSEACSLYFIVELALRIISMGFVFYTTKRETHTCKKKETNLVRRYMHCPFNCIDFFLVIVLIITLTLDIGPGADYDVYRRAVTTMKALKVLRPIRLAKSSFLKDTAQSLISAVKPLMDAGLINIFFIYVFAILGL
jgi:hypothetical protein